MACTDVVVVAILFKMRVFFSLFRKDVFVCVPLPLLCLMLLLLRQSRVEYVVAPHPIDACESSMIEQYSSPILPGCRIVVQP